jgi:hypothetical protein
MDATRIHTNAVIAKLQGAGLVVGDAIGKTAAGADLPKPHVVVYPGPGELMGTLDDPESDAEMTWRLIYVGSGREQVEFVRDKGRAAMLDGFDVDGRAIVRVTVDAVGSVERDDSVKPAVFYASEAYRVWSTPTEVGS